MVEIFTHFVFHKTNIADLWLMKVIVFEIVLLLAVLWCRVDGMHFDPGCAAGEGDRE